jgi:SAM-dependent methyltransferase
VQSEPTLCEAETPVPATRGGRSAQRLRSFDLKGHLAQTTAAPNKLRHVKVGLENWLTTELMKVAVRTQPKVPGYYQPRAGQYRKIEEELHSYAAKDKYAMVLLTMPLFGKVTDDGSIDWVREMNQFAHLTFHNYFLQPFHSIPGGWLNPLSAIGNAAAFGALYRAAHKRGADGLREDIAGFVPKHAKLIYDFGASTGGQSQAILDRIGADAKVVAIDPAAPGVILGKRQIRDARMSWIHGFVEDQDLTPGSADVVNMMFVAHECPDHIKRELLKAAYKVLKPGGVLVWTDPPPDDLCIGSRGFFEPYAWQWQQWSPDRELRDVGFSQIATHHVVDPVYMWTRVATR